MNTRIDFGEGGVPQTSAFGSCDRIYARFQFGTEPEIAATRDARGANSISFAIDGSCAEAFALRLEQLAAQVRSEAAKREGVTV